MKQLFLLFLAMGLVVNPLYAQSGSNGRRNGASAKTSASTKGRNTGKATTNAADGEGFVASRDSVSAENSSGKKSIYNPKVQRDPTLSIDDELILKDIAEKRRKEEAEARRREEERLRKLQEEEEKKRQWQLELLKHPELEVKRKIRIGGLIGKEVFFRDANKVYTAGSTISVIGESGERRQVKIVAVNADSVVFSYQGHQFVKKI